jgi:CRISPR-associated protein Csb1
MSCVDLQAKLAQACSSGYAACRAITELEPIGGEFDRILPPTYKGGHYATEKRRWNGREVDTVLLDSVQAQSNRFEALLQQAVERGEIRLPLIRVRFENGRTVTTLDAPHRVADAIFRDSELDGVPFRDSEVGKAIFAARPDNAVEIFRYAPTAPLFGMWDSTDLLKRPGAKFARALTSEIIGIGAQLGTRTASRIDPLGIRKSQRTMYLTPDGRWTFDPEKAARKKNSKGEMAPALVGKEGRPSDANHGNVLPDITHEEQDEIKIHGGVTISHAVQTTVLSFAQLRQLRFPCDGKADDIRDRAGRAVLAAIGIYAVALQWREGFQLRSRCQLVPKKPSSWQFIQTTAPNGETDLFEISDTVARDALLGCLEEAARRGLGWNDSELILNPNSEFAQLVRENDDYSVEAE